MKLRYLLPLLYVVASLFFLVFLGGAGHGHGGDLFYYISLPACLIVNHSDTGAAWWLCVLASLIQYATLGYLLERLIFRIGGNHKA